MSEHCGEITRHTKQRGKIRCCSWCGQEIKLGERYAKWLYFDGGRRNTVYAHSECCDAGTEAANEEHGMVYPHGDQERPTLDVKPE